MVHDLTAIENLALLLEQPTDDTIEVLVGLMYTFGVFLSDNFSKANVEVYERSYAIINEGTIDHHV